jgi:hypothetical protein
VRGGAGCFCFLLFASDKAILETFVNTVLDAISDVHCKRDKLSLLCLRRKTTREKDEIKQQQRMFSFREESTYSQERHFL